MMKQENNIVSQIANRYVSDDEVCLWYLGQEGFLIKTREDILAIDPYLTDSIDRMNAETPGFVRNYAEPLTPEECSLARMVLCTHDHQDHLDPDTIRRIDSKTNLFGAPAPVVGALEACGIEESRIIPLKHLEKIDFQGGCLIPVAAAHDTLHLEKDGYRELSFLFRFDNGITFFHGGDLVLYPGLEKLIAGYRPNIVMLPINGRCAYREQAGIVGNLSFTEALDFAERVGAEMIIPMHYDLYPANDENPAYFVETLYRKHFPMKFHMFMPGEVMCLNRQDWRK